MSLYNALKKILKEEQKARKEAEDKQQSRVKIPSSPSMPQIPKF